VELIAVVESPRLQGFLAVAVAVKWTLAAFLEARKVLEEPSRDAILRSHSVVERPPNLSSFVIFARRVGICAGGGRLAVVQEGIISVGHVASEIAARFSMSWVSEEGTTRALTKASETITVMCRSFIVRRRCVCEAFAEMKR
jgi:hypothetical protein